MSRMELPGSTVMSYFPDDASRVARKVVVDLAAHRLPPVVELLLDEGISVTVD